MALCNRDSDIAAGKGRTVSGIRPPRYESRPGAIQRMQRCGYTDSLRLAPKHAWCQKSSFAFGWTLDDRAEQQSAVLGKCSGSCLLLGCREYCTHFEPTATTADPMLQHPSPLTTPTFGSHLVYAINCPKALPNPKPPQPHCPQVVAVERNRKHPPHTRPGVVEHTHGRPPVRQSPLRRSLPLSDPHTSQGC